MDAFQYILQKFNITPAGKKMPLQLPIGRHELASLFGELGFTKGAEIGVQEGAYSETLLQRIPQLELYCVDPWEKYKGYRDHVDQKKLDRFYEFTNKRLDKYRFINNSPRAKIFRAYSLDFVKTLADESLDFVYIDGNHDLPNFVCDVYEWSKKIRLGGIIAGHDYHRFKKPNGIHVIAGVHAYTESFDIDTWFITDQTDWDCWRNEPCHQPSSFFWVKQKRWLSQKKI